MKALFVKKRVYNYKYQKWSDYYYYSHLCSSLITSLTIK